MVQMMPDREMSLFHREKKKKKMMTRRESPTAFEKTGKVSVHNEIRFSVSDQIALIREKQK